MNVEHMKLAAEKLTELLDIYSKKDERIERIRHVMTDILEQARKERQTEVIEYLPADYFFNEGGFREYPELESAYATFKVETSGGVSREVVELRKKIEAIQAQSKSKLP